MSENNNETNDGAITRCTATDTAQSHLQCTSHAGHLGDHVTFIPQLDAPPILRRWADEDNVEFCRE